jgi:hypothetical protein
MAVDVERPRNILVTLHKFCDKFGHDTKATIADFSRWGVLGSVDILPPLERVLSRDHSSKTCARAKLFKPTYQIATGALSH